jgi:hypothetical protein
LADAARHVGEYIRLAAASAGLIYALGVLVANAHMGYYGLYGIPLLRTSYILAGIWCLVPVCAALALAYVFVMIFTLITVVVVVQRGWRRRALTMLRGLAALGFLAVASVKTGDLLRTFGVRPVANWRYPFIFALAGVGWALYLQACRRKRRSGVPADSSKLPHPVERLYRAFVRILIGALAFMLGASYLIVFALAAYRTIPSHLGGGMPMAVDVLLDDGVDDGSIREWMGVDKDHKGPVRMQLLLVSEQEYTFLSVDGRQAFTLRRGDVKAVRFVAGGGDSNRPDGSGQQKRDGTGD